MKKIVYGVLAFAPMIAFAQSKAPNLTALGTLVDSIQGVVAKIVPLMFAVAIIYFFWGMIEFIRSAGDPKKAAEGKSIMIYGVIAIAVMISIYGLVAWLGGALGVDQGGTVTLPTLPTR